jgi:hypothetical protein
MDKVEISLLISYRHIRIMIETESREDKDDEGRKKGKNEIISTLKFQ